ncbi:MAG TPA: hypothetical protein VJM11_20870 [Nevskiaceae bacterium]|nr:hypothetical protein [Nevskiaceae bacterium]
MRHSSRSRSSIPFRRSRWAVAAVLASTSAAVAAPGDPVGGEFKIDTYNGVNFPAVATDGAGNFVVAWQGFDGSAMGVVVRRYNAAGVAQGSGTTVSGPNPAFSPSIAQAPDGRYVLAYTGSSAADPEGIFVRRFAADGTGAAAALSSP